MNNAFLRWWRALSIRPQLLLSYGCTVLIAFLIVMIITVSSIVTLRDSVLDKSTEELRRQIVANTGFILSESAEVFEVRLSTALQAFALPAAFSVTDTVRTDFPYSVVAPQSYADSSANHLKPPLTRYDKFPCVPTEPQHLQIMRGCIDGKKSISTAASGVFLTGLTLSADNAQALLDQHEIPVNQSAVMDAFVRDSWLSSRGSTGAWVSLLPGRLLRTYPGFVGNLSSDSSGVRTYSPTTRPWFTDHQNHYSAYPTAMTAEAMGRFSVVYSSPYYSLDGNGFLISISVPLHKPAPQRDFWGVAGTDVQLETLQDIVNQIRIRDTGSAHLYHVQYETVVASPQWQVDTTTTELMRLGEIRFQARDPSSPRLSGGPCSGDRQVDGYLVMRRSALGGDYCIAAVVPVVEVVRAVEEQRIEIMETAAELLYLSFAVLVICFLGFVMPCAFCIALQLSGPLMATSRETGTIVRNIGGDLLSGISEQKSSSCAGVGEVAQLRSGFLVLLKKLKEKRDRVAPPPANPCFGALDAEWDRVMAIALENNGGSAPDKGGFEPLRVQNGDAQMLGVEAVSLTKEIARARPRPLGRIRVRLCLQFIFPMMIALAVTISFTSINMYKKVDEWIEPVKQSMIEEELQTLNIRAYERAQAVAEILDSYSKTITMVKSYTEQIYSGQLHLADPYITPFAPASACPVGGLCPEPGLEGCRRQTRNDGSTAREVNYSTTVWYAPEHPVAPSSKRAPAGSIFVHGASAVDEQQGLATHLDNVARVAFWSSNATYVYFGFEHFEVYRQYPYMRQDWVLNSRNCNDAARTTIDRYTPLCRDWYNRAVEANGEIVFNTVDIDTVTGFPFASVSVALLVNNQLIGVAAVDANLGQLEQFLRNTPLYETGVAYLFDSAGYAVIHPSMDEGSSGGAQVPIEIIEGGEDLAFTQAFRQNVVQRWGENGTWSAPRQNMDGNMETWLYSFRRVPGSPYQLVLRVVEEEAQRAAQQLEDDLIALTTTHVVITLVTFVVAALFLIFLSFLYQGSFVKPITKLIRLIESSEECGYDLQVDAEDLAYAWSRELRTALKNFEKLIVALRFGNPKYHQGNKVRELENLRQAKELVDETGNKRGQGVCINNLGNLVRTMSRHDKEKARLIQDEANVEGSLRGAVANARELVAAGQADVSNDTIGQRLLGLALALLDDGKASDAVALLQEASAIHVRSASWQNLARLAFTLASRSQAKPLEQALQAELVGATEHAKAIVWRQYGAKHPPLEGNGSPVPGSPVPTEIGGTTERDQGILAFRPHESQALAQLCFALYIAQGGNKQWLWWALNRVPFMEPQVCAMLASHAKAGEEQDTTRCVDARLSQLDKQIRWRSGPIALPGEADQKDKVIIFLIDRTWTPILEVAIQAIISIFISHVGPGDTVALYSLGESWLIQPTQKGGNEDRIYNSIQNAERVSGKCKLYRSMQETLNTLIATRRGENVNRWLVVLTDLVDLEPADAFKSMAINLQGELKKPLTGKYTVAVIDSSSISGWEPHDKRWPTFRSNMKSFMEALPEGGKVGHHLIAGDLGELSEKFQEVAVLMADDGLAEDL